MAKRPAIPKATREAVLFEAGYCCAVCCAPLPLEYAHIVPWCVTHDHKQEHLIALCANCHSRADKEKWTQDNLRRFKQKPCALERAARPPLVPEQKALVDLIININPDQITERQLQVFIAMIEAYLGVRFGSIEVVSVSPANSTRIRLNLPEDAVARLLAGFAANDPILQAMFNELRLLRVEEVKAAEQHSPGVVVDKGMEQAAELLRRCQVTVASLNQEQQWQLTKQDEQLYVAAIMQHLPPSCTDIVLQHTAVYYHLDHKDVNALMDQLDQGHQEAWQKLIRNVMVILYHKNLHWKDDSSVASEDLEQVAALTLTKAIARFHYQSRFTTWAYRVIVNSVGRYLRDLKAKKRFKPTETLELHLDLEATAGGYEMAVSETEYKALQALITNILGSQPDQRLVNIFTRWAIDDASLSTIGHELKLSPARISVLIEQARSILRQHPDIERWKQLSDHDEREDDPHNSDP